MLCKRWQLEVAIQHYSLNWSFCHLADPDISFVLRIHNEDLILAVQSAGVSRGRNGFHKDKSGEKLAESEEDLLEHRTDGTDAFDTLYIGAEKFPFHDSFALSVSGVS